MPSKPGDVAGFGARDARRASRRHDADAVLDRRGRPRSGTGAELTKPSTWSTAQPGVGDRRAGGVDGERAQRPIGVPLDRALRVADDGDLLRARTAVMATLQAERGHRDVGREVLEGDGDARRRRAARRRVRRAADRSAGARAARSSSTSTSTNGSRRSRAGTTGAPRSTSAPIAAAADRHERESGIGAAAVRAHDVGRHASSCRTRAQRATVSTCSAAAAQYGADVVGTGTGRCGRSVTG